MADPLAMIEFERATPEQLAAFRWLWNDMKAKVRPMGIYLADRTAPVAVQPDDLAADWYRKGWEAGFAFERQNRLIDAHRVEELPGECHDRTGLGCDAFPCVENVSREAVLSILRGASK